MFFLFIILVFLQASFLSVNVFLTAILAQAMTKIDKSLILAVFLTGLLSDIVNQRLLGMTSLLYLIVCLLLFLYQRKFKTKNIFYILIFGLIILTIDSAVFNHNISLIKLFLELLVLFGWHSLFSLIGSKKEIYG